MYLRDQIANAQTLSDLPDHATVPRHRFGAIGMTPCPLPSLVFVVEAAENLRVRLPGSAVAECDAELSGVRIHLELGVRTNAPLPLHRLLLGAILCKSGVDKLVRLR